MQATRRPLGVNISIRLWWGTLLSPTQGQVIDDVLICQDVGPCVYVQALKFIAKRGAARRPGDATAACIINNGVWELW